MSETSKAAKKEVPVTRMCFVSGDKGGVGKSMVSTALIDYLDANGFPVMVVDADTSNPDVSRMFMSGTESIVPCKKINLKTEASWMELMDDLIEHSDHNFVISLPAGAGEFMQQYMKDLHEFVLAHKIAVHMELWWVLNKSADCVQLVETAQKSYGKYFSKIRIVLPKYWGSETDYDLWNKSPAKKDLEALYGNTRLAFPALHEECKTILWHPKTVMSYSSAEDPKIAKTLGMKASLHFKLTSYIKEVAACLNPIFKPQ